MLRPFMRKYVNRWTEKRQPEGLYAQAAVIYLFFFPSSFSERLSREPSDTPCAGE